MAVGVRGDDVLAGVQTPSAGLEMIKGHFRFIKNIKENHSLVVQIL